MGSHNSGGGGDSSNVCCYLKMLIRALAVAGLVWILLVGSPNGRRVTKETDFVGKLNATGRQVVMGTKNVARDPALDRTTNMSKRRVPNGPDPIHNRRAGKSGKPPGQA